METVKLLWYFLIVLPVATFGFPGFLLLAMGADTFDLWETAPATRILLPALGIVFGAIGVWLLAGTIRQVVAGNWGSIAPWHPPHHLVVRGVYRHVRNPFSAGVSSVLLGEALLTASLPILCWFAVYALTRSLLIRLVEEPFLLRRLGEDYRTYLRNVPRWVPRVTAWPADRQDAGG